MREFVKRRGARPLVLLTSLVFFGCPPRARVEHGTLLRWKKSSASEVRPVVEKRLALGKLRARVTEDDASLEVRVPEGGDVASVKVLLSLPGTFELCEELVADAGAGRRFDGVQVPSDCLKPRLMAGELREPGFAQVTWDAASARQVAELTQRLMGRRVVFLVDGKVLTAVVEAPITGTRSAVPIDSEVRLHAVLGGELTTLTLEEERRYP
jgi:hypothetical protein